MSAAASRRASALGWILAWIALAAACAPPASGPVPIAWGREPCAHCSMAISEPRFAAQLRLGPREVRVFDDLGCAVVWLEEHADAGPPLEIWAMDQEREEWIDARTASFRTGQRTPMGWGFGALRTNEAGTVDFESVRRSVLSMARERASRGGT